MKQLIEVQNRQQILAFAEGLGFKDPFIDNEASSLMTGYFNVYSRNLTRHLYGSWRKTIGTRTTGTSSQRYIFEVQEISVE